MITHYGRVTQHCIQNQSISVAVSPNVNENPGSSQQGITGERSVSHQSNINDNSVLEVKSVPTSSVNLSGDESSVN